MKTKCDYDEPKYEVGSIVLYDGRPYVVIGYELNFDYHDYRYELVPYIEGFIEFARKEELEIA